MRKRLILATVAVAVIACAVLGTLAMLPPRPGVTKANFARIEMGMTLENVIEVFGQEPTLFAGLAFGTLQNSFNRETWLCDDGAYASILFHNGAVYEMTWCDSTETFTDKIRRWLHLK